MTHSASFMFLTFSCISIIHSQWNFFFLFPFAAAQKFWCSLLLCLCSTCFIAFHIIVDISIFISSPEHAPLTFATEPCSDFSMRMMNNDVVHLLSRRNFFHIKSSFYSARNYVFWVPHVICFLFLGSNICHKNYVHAIKFMMFCLFMLFFSRCSSQFPYSYSFPSNDMSKLFTVRMIYPTVICYHASWHVWNVYNPNTISLSPLSSIHLRHALEINANSIFLFVKNKLHNKEKLFCSKQKHAEKAIFNFIRNFTFVPKASLLIEIRFTENFNEKFFEKQKTR